jgi:hypothetical protein
MKAKKTKNSSICFTTHCKMKLICGDCFEKIQKMARDNPRNKLFFSELLKFFTFHPFKKRLTATQRKEPTYCVMNCTRFKSNYRSCTGRSSENICSSSGGAQDKGKTG